MTGLEAVEQAKKFEELSNVLDGIGTELLLWAEQYVDLDDCFVDGFAVTNEPKGELLENGIYQEQWVEDDILTGAYYVPVEGTEGVYIAIYYDPEEQEDIGGGLSFDL